MNLLPWQGGDQHATEISRLLHPKASEYISPVTQGWKTRASIGEIFTELEGGSHEVKGSEIMKSKGELGMKLEQPWVQVGPWVSASLGTLPFLGS